MTLDTYRNATWWWWINGHDCMSYWKYSGGNNSCFTATFQHCFLFDVSESLAAGMQTSPNIVSLVMWEIPVKGIEETLPGFGLFHWSKWPDFSYTHVNTCFVKNSNIWSAFLWLNVKNTITYAHLFGTYDVQSMTQSASPSIESEPMLHWTRWSFGETVLHQMKWSLDEPVLHRMKWSLGEPVLHWMKWSLSEPVLHWTRWKPQ